MWPPHWRLGIYLLVLALFDGAFAFGKFVNGFQCYVCSSEKLETCTAGHHSNHTELAFESCPKNVSSCFTQIENGITYRGCLSHDDSAMSKCVNSDKCVICSSNKCNGNAIDLGLNSLQAGFLSRFCYECDSRNDPKCIGLMDDSMLTKCPDSGNIFMGCFHLIETDSNDSIVLRGCVSNLKKDYCVTNDTNCKICYENGCNRVGFTSCVTCNSDNDPNCIGHPEKSLSSICKRNDDKCFTHIERFNVSRGCLGDQNHEFQKSCRKTKEKCSLCSTTFGNDCNNMKVTPQTCVECNSSNNEKYQNESTELKGKLRNTVNFNDKKGRLLNTNSKYNRGFVRDFDEKLKDPIQYTMKISQTCYFLEENQLNSSLDTRAITNQRQSMKTCQRSDDKCLTLVSDKNSIIKDCLLEYAVKRHLPNDFLEKLNKSAYRVCATPLCNDETIEPMYCIKCDSSVDKNCNDRVKCPLEIKASGCYHHSDGQHVKKGCIAELDEKMRSACESDSNECKMCNGDECNRRTAFRKCIIENPHVDAHSVICKKYLDECFIHVINETIRRGCTSDLIESPIDGIDFQSDCLNGTNCEICKTNDDCNDRKIKNDRCIHCTSKITTDCIYWPEHLPFKKCPLTLNARGCYLLQDKLYVQRGCMLMLSSKDQENCGNGNDTCKACFGDKCNVKKTFQKCLVCDSEKVFGINCLNSSERYSKIKTCPNYLDHCYTKVDDQIVMRNCIGDITVPTVDECEENPDTCKHCSDGWPCNNMKINPITCIACDSLTDPTCAKNSTFEMIEECPIKNIHQQKCYHYINETTGQHIRGCVTNLQEPISKICDDNRECKTCVGSNCNSRRSLSRCLDCNTVEDSQCAINPLLVKSKICDAYDDKCYTFIAKSNVTRGCLNEQKKDFEANECSDDDKCAICTTTDGNNCNNRTIDMETCVHCDTLHDENCAEDPNSFKGKICSGIRSTQREGCYLRVINGRYRRGCIRDVSKRLSKICRNQTDTCKTCQGKDCNAKQDFQTCIFCNSKENNECSQNRSTNWIQCENYLSTCLTGIDAHGHTHRRCSKDYDSDSHEFPNNDFVVCTKNKCNTIIYPPDRLQCYECSGEEKCNFMPSNSTETPDRSRLMKPCNILSKFDQCYVYQSKDKNIYRGCLTDSTDHRLLCEQENVSRTEVCVKCKESGCNDIPKIRPPTLSCVNCNRTEECAFGFAQNTAIPCKKNVRIGSHESCYTHHNPDEGWTERGCTLDDINEFEITEDIQDIEICLQSGCNKENILHSFCVVCKSDEDDTCASMSDPRSLMKKCKGTYTYEQRGCFIIDKNKTIHRGCIKDLSEDEYKNCKKEDKKCKLCLESNCNIDSGGSSSNVNSVVTILAIVFIHLLTNH